METVGSCQEVSPGKAYIQCLSSEIGGNYLADELRDLGIVYESKIGLIPASIKKGSKQFDELRFHSVRVNFPTNQIENATQSLKALLDSQGIPAWRSRSWSCSCKRNWEGRRTGYHSAT